MKHQQNIEKHNSTGINTYSNREIKNLLRNAKRRQSNIFSFIRKQEALNRPINCAITIAWHALVTAGERHYGHIIGMQPNKRQQHLMRKIRGLAKSLNFTTSYIWVRATGARMGEHIHLALHWPHTFLMELIRLLEQLLGCDVNHEIKNGVRFIAVSQCKGWRIDAIDCLHSANRWGHYMATQKIKHIDLSSSRNLGFSQTL